MMRLLPINNVLNNEELLVLSNFYGKECNLIWILAIMRSYFLNYEDSTITTKTLRPYESLILHK